MKIFKPNPETMLEDLMRLAHQRASGTREKLRAASAKGQAVRRENNRRKRLAAARAKLDAFLADVRVPRPKGSRDVFRPRKVGERTSDRFLIVMEPGRWYGHGEVTRAAGEARNWRGKFLQELRKHGLVERTRNPAWEGTVPPQKAGLGDVEPQWLWRLTPAGETRRAAVLAVS